VESVRTALARRALDSGRGAKQALAEAGIPGSRQWRRMLQRQGQRKGQAPREPVN
jgi:hypothetical protein